MKLLLVEDEKRMSQALSEILRQEKYEVDHCADGILGLDAIESNIYDIIILDIMLPGKNGFAIAKEARKNGIRTPILMLTAKSDLDDKVFGLDDKRAFGKAPRPYLAKYQLRRRHPVLRRHYPGQQHFLLALHCRQPKRPAK